MALRCPALRPGWPLGGRPRPPARSFLGPVLALVSGFLGGCGGSEGTGGGGTRSPDHRAPLPAPAEGIPPEGAGKGVRIADAGGRILELAHPPSRLISLVPSATETLLALGAGHLLVARTRYDTASALAHLPSVGGGLHPSLEAIVAAGPQVVVTFAGETDPVTAARLEAAGIAVFRIRPESLGEIRRTIRDLGRLVGRDDRADSILAALDQELEALQRRLQGRPKVRAAWLLGGHPPWVAGPGSYLDEVLGLAGGENVFHDAPSPYLPVSLEEFLVRRIDLILVSPGADSLLTPLPIPRITPPPALERPGPDLARWIRELARLLHPEAFL